MPSLPGGFETICLSANCSRVSHYMGQGSRAEAQRCVFSEVFPDVECSLQSTAAKEEQPEATVPCSYYRRPYDAGYLFLQKHTAESKIACGESTRLSEIVNTSLGSTSR